MSLKVRLKNASMLFRLGKAKRDLEKQEQRAVLKKIGLFRMRCNLCARMFRANSRFLRFCRSCKLEDETFRFADWMPA